MGEHYFTKDPQVGHQIQQIQAVLRQRKYTFFTDAGVFSRQRIDRGSELLIEVMQIPKSAKVLDMGCGYGVIGIVAADLASKGQVWLIDINQRAVDLARENLLYNQISNAQVRQNDGFRDFSERDFDIILMNPPFRAGKKVVYPLIERAKQYLVTGGVLYTVCLTRQGAKSLAKKMAEVFGTVDEVKKGSGYRVYRAEKGVRIS